MKSESKEIETESAPEILVDQVTEDFVEIRKWSVMTAMEYWDKRIETSAETPEPLAYPAHIQTVLDTAWYIEQFLAGDFKSA